MNLPILIKKLYPESEFAFTGLYSFEFVDKNQNTIIESFFMVPPKNKTVSESTRSTTVPTLGGNYTIDGGNSTKNITLVGELYFPYFGSPDNPIARDNSGLENLLSGLEEFIKMRWMLVRYRDYTMTPGSRMTVPTSILSSSPEIQRLYKEISKRAKSKAGGLYDEIKVIFHDYDMDDHFYCRVDNFTSSQSDSKYIAIEYNISIECYEPVSSNRNKKSSQSKPTTNEKTDNINLQLQNIDFNSKYNDIQGEFGENVSFINTVQTINNTIENIGTENENIQSGKSTAKTLLPIYASSLIENVNSSLSFFIDSFLSTSQRTLYLAGSLTIDEVVSIDQLAFYNSLQKVKIYAKGLLGVLNSIPEIDELRYSENSDDYTLTEEQFDDEDASKVENTISFFYYTVLEGDTARIVAQRELNDQEKFIQILKLNNITENNFIDGTIVGQKIKIPLPLNYSSRGEDNLIYESNYNDPEKYFFGSDLYTDKNNKLQTSETGDLSNQIGIENVFRNIEKRIQNLKGSLNVFQNDWGTVSINDGNTPYLVKVDRYLSNVVSQIQSEPRVESVEMDLDKIEIQGEKLSVPTKVFFIGTEETREVSI